MGSPQMPFLLNWIEVVLLTGGKEVGEQVTIFLFTARSVHGPPGTNFTPRLATRGGRRRALKETRLALIDTGTNCSEFGGLATGAVGVAKGSEVERQRVLEETYVCIRQQQ